MRWTTAPPPKNLYPNDEGLNYRIVKLADAERLWKATVIMDLKWAEQTHTHNQVLSYCCPDGYRDQHMRFHYQGLKEGYPSVSIHTGDAPDLALTISPDGTLRALPCFHDVTPPKEGAAPGFQIIPVPPSVGPARLDEEAQLQCGEEEVDLLGLELAAAEDEAEAEAEAAFGFVADALAAADCVLPVV
eukprot:tig00021128_g18886.t1